MDSGPIYVTGSVGIARADAASDTCESLLREADSAMYQAKASGPGEWLVYQRGLHSGAEERLRMERHLREALDRGELWVAYQPVVSLHTGHPVGAEALLRWDSPVFGSVSPTRFVPLAEEIGLIASLGDWVMRRAVADLATWRAQGLVGEHFRVAVNVSTRQLSDALVSRVAEISAEFSVPTSALSLEITEGALLSPETATPLLERLHGLGVSLALDDFGTGYASLSHVHRYPFAVLKIDRSFITELARPRTGSLVKAILSMAEALDLRVVAEGIETAEQAAALRSAGCPAGQGYLFGRPMPEAELVRWLEEHALAAAYGVVGDTGIEPVTSSV